MSHCTPENNKVRSQQNSRLHPRQTHMANKTEPIRVCVRVRPDSKAASNFIHTRENPPTITLGRNSNYKFDAVLGPSSSNLDLFQTCGLSIVQGLFDGRNGCVFAHGLTGSGKTHSMLGQAGGQSHLDGLIPQCARKIFQHISEQETSAKALGAVVEHRVTASYIEVFNGKAFDLLTHGGNKRAPLKIRGGHGATDAYADGAVTQLVKTTHGLMVLIRLGSQRRQTASTGMNVHSSRSHAILSLSMERRWKKHSTSKISTSQTVRLLLIDLAGSENCNEAHNGERDVAGSAVNLGLMSLSACLDRLHSGAKHVPYRDQVLTRLMEPVLGGSPSTTWMLACVHPSSMRERETTATLEFATRLGNITTSSARAAVRTVRIHDPMENDFHDRADMGRRACWIPTSTFGDIFARIAGHSDKPLLLYVHGSGPRNSSLEWNWLVQDLLNRTPGKFYHVAIDCPGYGRSLGDRQHVRSTPGELLSEIVHALGKNQAHTLLGCSQGACAVFNAALDMPELCANLAVYHPVGHDVSRYKAIHQRTLLCFDIDDDGHPVKVGRRMRDALQSPFYFEHRGEDASVWCHQLGARMTTELLNMYNTSTSRRHALVGASSSLDRSEYWEDHTRVAGGLCCWLKPHDREISDYADYGGENFTDEGCFTSASTCTSNSWESKYDADGSVDGSSEENKEQDTSTEVTTGTWVARLRDAATIKVVYFNAQTGETTSERPIGQHIRYELESGGEHGDDGGGGGGGNSSLFADAGTAASSIHGGGKEDVLTQQHRERVKKRHAKEQRTKEIQQTLCERCASLLLSTNFPPVRVSGCRHLLCSSCADQCLKFHRHCPVKNCSQTTKRTDATNVDEEVVAMLGTTRMSDRAKHQNQQPNQQCFFRGGAARVPSVVLEMGNTAVCGEGGNKTKMKTFLKVLDTEFGRKSIVKSVGFNINPSYKKPTIVHLKPNERNAYTLERNLSFRFPCFAVVTFTPESNISSPLIIKYWTQMDQKKSSLRISIVAGRSKEKRRRSRKDPNIEYDAEQGDGWVMVDDETGTVCCTYNSSGVAGSLKEGGTKKDDGSQACK